MHWGIAFDTPPTLTPQDPVPVVPALLQRPSKETGVVASEQAAKDDKRRVPPKKRTGWSANHWHFPNLMAEAPVEAIHTYPNPIYASTPSVSNNPSDQVCATVH